MFQFYWLHLLLYEAPTPSTFILFDTSTFLWYLPVCLSRSLLDPPPVILSVMSHTQQQPLPWHLSAELSLLLFVATFRICFWWIYSISMIDYIKKRNRRKPKVEANYLIPERTNLHCDNFYERSRACHVPTPAFYIVRFRTRRPTVQAKKLSSWPSSTSKLRQTSCRVLQLHISSTVPPNFLPLAYKNLRINLNEFFFQNSSAGKTSKPWWAVP